MRGQRFAIRVELFPTRSLPNRSKHVFSAAGAAAGPPTAPPTAQAAQKSQSRPPEPPEPGKRTAALAKRSICKRVFSRTLRKSTKNLVARLLLLWSCHSQCGPDTLEAVLGAVFRRLLLWQKQRKTQICEPSGQKAFPRAYTDIEASAIRSSRP